MLKVRLELKFILFFEIYSVDHLVNFLNLDNLFTNISVFPKGLVEMMSAYFPDFSQIETTKVCEWIFELANEMSKKKSNPENHSNEASKK